MRTDDELKKITKDEANKLLDSTEKARWVELHAATANTYVVRDGEIKDVPPAGWWY